MFQWERTSKTFYADNDDDNYKPKCCCVNEQYTFLLAISAIFITKNAGEVRRGGTKYAANGQFLSLQQ